MTSKKPGKLKKRFGDCRECLVCGGKTISAHLGMDLCRACSVFYRRSVGQRVYECRSGTNKCEVNKGDSCRRCRFERIKRLLEGTGQAVEEEVHTDHSPPADLQHGLAGDSDHTHRCEPSSSATVCCLSLTPILERVRAAHRTMSQIRLMSELLARAEPPHPMLMNEEDCPYEKATFGSMMNSNRILLSSILGFGKTAFPEVATLSRELQWSISMNFMYRFGPFEASYRAEKLFPEHKERLCAGYTYWFSHNYDEHFFSDCPNPIDVEHMKTSMHNHCKVNHTNFRTLMNRLKLAEPEFFLLTALLFWTTENLELPDSLVSLGEKYRAAIMQELHFYFREQLRMDNYAARLGELLTAIQMFDKIDAMKENFEFLRLMNVFSDDTFLYRIQHEDIPKAAVTADSR